MEENEFQYPLESILCIDNKYKEKCLDIFPSYFGEDPEQRKEIVSNNKIHFRLTIFSSNTPKINYFYFTLFQVDESLVFIKQLVQEI